jgi:hypothetical protein
MREGLRSQAMPTYRISIVNEDFSASDERDLPDIEAARREALRGAVAMGGDHLIEGEKLFGAEVSVSEGGNTRQRFVVTVSASPLKG